MEVEEEDPDAEADELARDTEEQARYLVITPFSSHEVQRSRRRRAQPLRVLRPLPLRLLRPLLRFLHSHCYYSVNLLGVPTRCTYYGRLLRCLYSHYSLYALWRACTHATRVYLPLRCLLRSRTPLWHVT